MVLQLNLKPVFVDVDPVFYELDPAKIEAAITPRTRCLIPVHLFGSPCDMDPIMAIAKRHGLRVVEDSCETMFTKYKGRSVGSFGDVGCFSTYVAHILTTGVGGLCTTNDPELAISLRSLMNHGRDSIYLSIDDDKDKTKEELQMIVARRFSFVQMGYSFRVTEMEGALGLAEFENHAEMMAKRRANGDFFNERLKRLGDSIQLPTVRPESGHAFMMYPIVLKKEKKTELVNFLEQNGIETRDMLPLINQPFYKELFKLDENQFPVAKWINENGFYIASHQDLSDDEKEYIVERLDAYFSERKLLKEKSALVLLSKNNGRAAEMLFDSLPLASFDELIVVEAGDDGRVPEFFAAKGFKVIREQGGKGLSVKRAVESTQCENVVLMGLDGADDPRDLDKLLIKLKQGSELVVASRFMYGGGRQTTRPLSYRGIGNRFFTFLLGVLF
ncbi:MAG: DegT/DnrJ/EryC1/StrS family aminotransferase, partial [Deltaproteobacteria bacterium]|nr:DegT/DnrJ/EryC1/StrS family aminotransferase [Deltaproteobacteria bacterium]